MLNSKARGYIYGKIKRLTESSSLFRLVFFLLAGVFSVFKNVIISSLIAFRTKFSRSSNEPLRVVIIAPLNSPHLQTFLSSFEKHFHDNRDLNILLINSTPEHLAGSFDWKYPMLGKEIYYLLGYRSDPVKWSRDIHLRASNNLVKVAEDFIKSRINKFRPDIIWLHDLQSAGYLVGNILASIKDKLPKLNVYASVWGNDLYHFYEHPAHLKQLRSLMPLINYLHAEARRDEIIAKKVGFSGEMLPVCSITLNSIEKFLAIPDKQNNKNERDIYILLKGTYYLRTNLNYFFDQLQQSPDFWMNKKILLLGPSDEDRFRCEKLVANNGLKIEMLDSVDHSSYIDYLCRSKYHLSSNLSDGIPNSAAEAVFAGCLPVFSNHTGLSDLLSVEQKKSMEYQLGECDFIRHFEMLDVSCERDIILQSMRVLFESVVFSPEITCRVFAKI